MGQGADKDKNSHSVPDAGSTAALLGFSVVLLALSQRKTARRIPRRV